MQTTTDEAALLAGIAASPHDTTPRLVYADYLEEIGRAEAARNERLRVAQKRICEEPASDEARLEWARIAESVPVDEGELEKVRRELAKESKFWEGAECVVCGNTPDEDGELRHGRGCYKIDEDGGGSEWFDVRPDWTALRAREAALTRTLSLHRRAEFVRVQVELHDKPCHAFMYSCHENGESRCSCSDPKYDALRARERELLDENWGPWIRGMGIVPDGWKLSTDGDDFHVWQDTPYHDGLRFQFASGFIDRITCTWQTWLTHGQHIAWRPGWTQECPNCEGEGTNESPTWENTRVPCPDCGGQFEPRDEWGDPGYSPGTGRTPRPFTGHEQPVTELVLTTRPPSEWGTAIAIRRGMSYLTDSYDAIFAAEWPGLKVRIQ